ncbi:MAG: hypothetical protein PUK59_00465 [Actinomycetaceae bacterium]|nr:hypothetical protein [Actinomycetaceae bacterium]MDY5854546.1 hypothetical protein [Arcanobacterium sp.]
MRCLRAKYRPGERRDDQQIVARATVYSTLVVTAGAVAAALGALWWYEATVAASLALGAAIVVVSNLMQWGAMAAVPLWFPRSQGVAFSSVFVLKLVLLVVALAVLLPLPWFKAQAFFAAFAVAVLVSLAVSSAVVMREQGPGIGA